MKKIILNGVIMTVAEILSCITYEDGEPDFDTILYNADYETLDAALTATATEFSPAKAIEKYLEIAENDLIIND